MRIKGAEASAKLARRLTKTHGSDGATGNLMTAPGHSRPIPRFVMPGKPDISGDGLKVR